MITIKNGLSQEHKDCLTKKIYKCKSFINGLKGGITFISINAEKALDKVLHLILKAFN